ncbi:MAG: bifunctional 2-methylcitrate synthase/citrate synthase [Alphaproteobacteria bacterium]
MTEIYKGLVGVTVDETTVSKVMVETNSLTYRGYAVQDLAAHCRFEEVAYLILNGELPTPDQLDAFNAQERAARSVDDRMINTIRQFSTDAHPMDTIRTCVSQMGTNADDNWSHEPEKLMFHSIEMLAKIPTCVAADYRVRKGLEPIAPNPDLGFSENFFHMCFGEVPPEEVIRCFDISLTLYAEHSFNASTFTARVIASSLADIYGAVTGAIASLKGPLHGGANEAVMHMLKDIKTVDEGKAFVQKALAEKQKIMGFGHRVYTKGDSRVPTMYQAFLDLARVKGETELVEIHKAIWDDMVAAKGIHPNLDYPAGPAYYLMGFDIDMFTPIFVMSRITGWSAHVMEQLADNRLIRPLSAYTGAEQREVMPLDKRAMEAA